MGRTERIVQFTEEDIRKMTDHETRTGQKVIYSFEDKCAIYSRHERSRLELAEIGISNAIHARLSLDNDDIFDGPDDQWKLKVLEDNLAAIRQVLNGSYTPGRKT